MRVLCTFVGGIGHAEPLLPVADALRSAGHHVAFAGDRRPLAHVARQGYPTFAVDGDEPEPARTRPSRRQPLVPPDRHHEEQVIRDHYVRWVPRLRIEPYRRLCRDWRPDMVVRDEADFGAAVLTERLGIACAVVLVLAAGRLNRPAVVAEPLAFLRDELGLAAGPTLGRLRDDLVLSPFPPSFRDPALGPLPRFSYQPRPATAALPQWWAGLGDRPIAYLTLGSVFPLESGDLFDRLLAGLTRLPVDIVATLGADLDPADFGPQPDSVHLERWLPRAALLPHVRLVVSHGGSGTVADALRAGLPQLVVALGADQLDNATRVVELGLGATLDPVTASPAEVAGAAAALLSDESVAQAAQQVRAESAALPWVDDTVGLIETLVRPGVRGAGRPSRPSAPAGP